MNRICKKCNQEKDITEFSPQRVQNGKYEYRHPWCKSCKAAIERARRLEKREEISRLGAIRWRAVKKEKSKKQKHEYYLRTRDRALLMAKESRARQLAGTRGMRMIKVVSADEVEAYRKSVEIRAIKKEQKVQSLVASLRARIKSVIKLGHSGSSLELLGCTPEFVRSHIESQFRNGMTWDNHGAVWHIDHIIPVSAFDLTSEEGCRLAFNWANLRPLFAEDNLKKWARLPDNYEEVMQKIKQAVGK